MTSAINTFRVFVSSPFHDLKAERDALQEHVFPRLHDLCMSYGARFQAIDLRWGVSEGAALDHQTMPICLRELERSQRITARPNFVVLLGDRYGWRPLPERILETDLKRIVSALDDPEDRVLLEDWFELDANNIPPVFRLRARAGGYEAPEHWNPVEQRLRTVLESGMESPAPANRTKYLSSATEQEVEAGAIAPVDANEHVFAFFRSIRGLPLDSRAGPFVDLKLSGDLDSIARDRLRVLKRRLSARLGGPRGGHVFEYEVPWSEVDERPSIGDDYLSRLCSDVYRSLESIILSGLATLEVRRPLAREIEAHASFGRERARDFVGRGEVRATLQEYLRSSESRPLVVRGEPGSGKSALLAKTAESCTVLFPEMVTVVRFVGASPSSTNGRELIASLADEIGHRYVAASGEGPLDYPHLVSLFVARLSLAREDKPLAILVDAVDQLPAADPASGLGWIPVQLPKHVKFVISTSWGDTLVVRGRLPSALSVTLGAMTTEEAHEVLGKWLRAANRSLTDAQSRVVFAGFQRRPLPLYLKLAFEEARLWRSSDRVVPASLPADTEGMIHRLLDRLSEDANHSSLLVSRSLAYLAASKSGLTEDEIVELLGRDEGYFAELLSSARHDLPVSALAVRRIPIIIWLRLRLDLDPYLSECEDNGTTLLTFYHPLVAEVVSQRYLAGDDGVERHRELSSYYQNQSLHQTTEGHAMVNRRKLTELPYQQAHARQWSELEGTLGEFSFIDAKLRSHGLQNLLDDFSRVAEMDRQGEALDLIQRALELAGHILAIDPSQLCSQLWGRLGSEDSTVVKKLLRDSTYKGTWLRPLGASLNQPGGPLQRTLAGHEAAALTVAVTPEGDLALSGAGDGSLKIWDLRTGKERMTLRGHAGAVTSAAVSADGRFGYSLSEDRTLRAWDLQTGVNLRTRDLGVSGGWPIATSLSGRKLLVGRVGRRRGRQAICHDASVFDAETFEEVSRFRTTGTITAIPGTDFVVVHSGGQRIEVWDFDKEEIKAATDSHGHGAAGVGATTLTPDGTTLICAPSEIVGLDDPCVSVWDLRNGARLHQLFSHALAVGALAVTKDGGRLISGSADHSVRVWDLEDGHEIACYEGHSGAIQCLCMIPDGNHVLSVGDDGVIKLWQLGERTRPATRRSSRKDREEHEVLAHESHEFTSPPTEDGTAEPETLGGLDWEFASIVPVDELFGAEDIREYRRNLTGESSSVSAASLPEPHETAVRSIVIPPRGAIAVSASRESLRAWDLDTGSLVAHHRLGWQWKFRGEVLLTVDGRFAAVPAIERDDLLTQLLIWEPVVDESRELIVTSWDRRDGVLAMAPIPGSHGAMIATHSGIARWDLARGEREWFINADEDPVTAVAVTADGSVVVIGTRSGGVRTCHAESGATLHAYEGHGESTTDLAVFGDVLASASRDGSLSVWSPDSRQARFNVRSSTPLTSIGITCDGQFLVCTPKGRAPEVRSSGDGQLVRELDNEVAGIAIAGSEIPGVCTWSRESLRAYDLHSRSVSAAFTADGAITAAAWNAGVIGAGDNLGRVHWLRLENGAATTLALPPTRVGHRTGPESGRDWPPRATRRPTRDVDPRARADSLHRRALKERSSGHTNVALKLLRQEEIARREAEDPGPLGDCLGMQAHLLITNADASQAELETAARLLLEHEAICRKLGNKGTLEITLGNLGYVHVMLRQPKAAMRAFVECGEISYERGDSEGLQRHQLFQQKLLLEYRRDAELVIWLAGLALEGATKQKQGDFAKQIKAFLSLYG